MESLMAIFEFPFLEPTFAETFLLYALLVTALCAEITVAVRRPMRRPVFSACWRVWCATLGVYYASAIVMWVLRLEWAVVVWDAPDLTFFYIVILPLWSSFVGLPLALRLMGGSRRCDPTPPTAV